MAFGIDGSPEERLDQIIHFWVIRTRHWRPPSEYLKKAVAVMRLHDIRDLSRNAKLSLSRIFPRGLDFCVVGTVQTKNKVLYTVKCTWPRGGETFAKGITAEKAEHQAARKALSRVLGGDLPAYETICSAKNYDGISEQQFTTAWARVFKWWDFRTLRDPPPLRFPRQNSRDDNRHVQVSSSNRRDPNVSHVGVLRRIELPSTSSSSRGSSDSGISQQEEMRAAESGSRSDSNEPSRDSSDSGAGTSNSQTASVSKEQSKSTTEAPTINKPVEGKDQQASKPQEGKYTQTSKPLEGKNQQNSGLQSTMNPAPAKSVIPVATKGQNTSNVSVHYAAELDSSILDWDPVRWKPLLKKEREDVLFRFWSKTSSTEFPRIFSLLGQRNVTTSNCLRAFNSLFTNSQSEIEWTKKGESPARVSCKWKDSNNKWSEPVEGEGKLMDDAKRDAAHKALLNILGETNLKLLEHICRPFFVEGPENQKVDLNSLKKRILDGRNNVRTPLTSPITGTDKRAQLELAVARRISAGCDGESRLTPEKTSSNHSDPIPTTSTTAASSQTNIPRRLQLPSSTSTVVVPSIPETPPTTPTDRVQTVNIEQPATASISGPTASSPVTQITNHSHPAMSSNVEADPVQENFDPPASSCSSGSSLVIRTGNSSAVHTSSSSPIRGSEEGLVDQSRPRSSLPTVETAAPSEETQVKHAPQLPSHQSSTSHIPSSLSETLNGTSTSDPSAGENSQNPRTRVRVASGTSQHPSTSKKRKESEIFDDHPFAEYFSTNDEGTVKVSPWLMKYFKDSLLVDVEEEERKREESKRDLLKIMNERKENDTPFLPFDKILGYEFPQEAEIALELLFEGRKEPKSVYETTKYVLAEVTVGSKVFQGLGMTEEEAKENAAAEAVKFLTTTCDDEALNENV